METNDGGFDSAVERAWSKFMVHLVVRVARGDHEEQVVVEFADGSGNRGWIRLIRRGDGIVAIGSGSLGHRVSSDIADLPGYRLHRGRAVAHDRVPVRVVVSTIRALREVIGVPHPAFLQVRDFGPAQARASGSSYVERDQPSS